MVRCVIEYIVKLDWYGLALSKLCTTRKKDLKDLRNYIIPNIEDWDKLLRMLESYKCEVIGAGNTDMNFRQWDDMKAIFDE